VDSAGNLLIADSLHYRIAVVAAKTGTFYGQAMRAGDIYSVAGNGQQGVSASGVAATRTTLGDPVAVAVDANGNLVIADAGFALGGRKHGGRIQVVAVASGRFYGQAMTAGDIYTVAGNGDLGFSGDSGPATKASISGQIGPARVDTATGNLVLADTGLERIRLVAAKTGTFYGQAMKAGDIYTIAGNGTPGFFGDGGPATSANLDIPSGVAVDGAGNVLIADKFNLRVRAVAARTGTFYGQKMTAGDIYTVAGDGGGGFAGDGGPATRAHLKKPEGVAVDTRTGSVLVADSGNNLVRVVAGSTGTFYGQAMTAGDIYTVAGNRKASFSGDRGPATSAELNHPPGVAVTSTGNMLIADANNSRVRLAAATSGTFYGQAMTAGDIYTVAGNGSFRYAGDGGPATRAGLNAPKSVAVDAAGNLLIADSDNATIRVVAARTGTFYGRAMTAGDIYTVAGNGHLGFSGDGGPATSAELFLPTGVAVDGSGNLLIADELNNRVRVVAARTGTFYGQAMTASDIYTVAGDGSYGYAGDGGPAKNAKLNSPENVAADAAGNLLIADTFNQRVRVVAAASGTFYGQPMTAGDIYTVAGNGTAGFSGDGGPAKNAEFEVPNSVAVDRAGNLLIADELNNRVRVVAARTGTFYGQAMTARDIYTVAGNGTEGYSGDGGPATSAELTPTDVVADTAGNLLIADLISRRVREVSG